MAKEGNGLCYDSLISAIQSYSSQIKDHRRNNVSYSLTDTIMSAYAMFALKYGSLLALDRQRMKSEEINLRRLYGIRDIPSDTMMRKTLDGVSPDKFHDLQAQLIQKYERVKKLDHFKVLDGYLLCPMDGVSFFSSTKVHCSHCQERKSRDGVIHYSHGMLCAVVVHPKQNQVLPLGCEPIQKQDGAHKNDHELVAAKRLWQRLWAAHPNKKFLHTGDALFANGPMIRQIKETGHSFLLNVKPDSHELLFEHLNNPMHEHAYEKVRLETLVKGGKEEIELSFCNGLPLNATCPDIRVNFLIAKVKSKGKTTTFTWVTDLKITTKNAATFCGFGRARWKIENETFNTLKNQGYNFEHNYGHGKKNLSNTLAILMMIAFLVDQIQQLVNKVFIKLVQAKGTKTGLWEDLRAIFKVIELNSYQHLLKVLSVNYST
jgi:hypothetical protein